MYAKQSASQSLPRLSRLFVNPGIMCPVQACGGSAAGFVSVAAAVETMRCPEAVRMVVDGPPLVMIVTGAVDRK